METRVKLNIVDDMAEPFMGPGVLYVLEQVRRYRSINRAAEQMSLSLLYVSIAPEKIPRISHIPVSIPVRARDLELSRSSSLQSSSAPCC